MTIGYITKKGVNRTTLCAEYIELVRQALGQAAISTDADVEEDKHSLCAQVLKISTFSFSLVVEEVRQAPAKT